jgi:hypothetical protein
MKRLLLAILCSSAQPLFAQSTKSLDYSEAVVAERFCGGPHVEPRPGTNPWLEDEMKEASANPGAWCEHWRRREADSQTFREWIIDTDESLAKELHLPEPPKKNF